MDRFLKKEKKLGVIGAGPDLDQFVLKANALGYRTYQLCESEEVKRSSQADKLFIGSLSDARIQKEFIMPLDVLAYFDSSIDTAELESVKKHVHIPQGADLLAISQDRSFQKAFYESVGVNIAPYEMIVEKEDIVEALPSIGYPAVLRSNFIQEDGEFASAFIYEETDIDQASDLLEYGPAILESWIIAEDYLAITAVKTREGLIQFYPTVKKEYKDGRLAQLMKFETENQELVDEIKKAAQLIIEKISFTGLITLNFIVSPADALYLGYLSPYPSVLSRYSEGDLRFSSLNTHLRALTSLPVPTIHEEELDFIYRPLYANQKEEINELFLEEPMGQFYFYPWTKKRVIGPADEIGYFLIENIKKNE